MYPIEVGPPEIGRSPLDLMLRHIRDNLKNERTIVQYVFRSNGEIQGATEFPIEYAKYRDEILKTYGAKGVGGQDFAKGHPQGLETLVPQYEKDYLEAINFKVFGPQKAQTSMKMFAFCKKADLGYTENTLEKTARVFYGQGSFRDQGMEKKYLTATDQKYYSLKNYQPEAQEIYDCYWFPSQVLLEMVLEPLYEQWYYPNENRYRRYTMYTTLLKRDINAAWNGDITLNSYIDLSYIFQLPTYTSLGRGMLTETQLSGIGSRDHANVFDSGQSNGDDNLGNM
jgi:hypothetical protein